MKLEQFFSPVRLSAFAEWQELPGSEIGGALVKHLEDQIPKIQKHDLALIGVKTSPEDHTPDWIRKYLYPLKDYGSNTRKLDLGDFAFHKNDSNNIEQFAFGLSEVIDHGGIPVLLGGNQEITYIQYLAYESLKRLINLGLVDARLDFSQEEQFALNPDTYLQDILLRDPTYLFNLSLIGYQSYFCRPELVDTMESMHFDLHRLGKIRDQLKHVEPLIRNADVLSFDLSAIRQSDAPANNHPTPNGFHAEEACLIARYAGLSDQVSSIGFYEFNPGFDLNGQTAHLVAQLVWYFMEGYANRHREHPLENEEDFFRFITTLKDHAYQIVFFKSKKTDRWWMEVPINHQDPAYEGQQIIPCAYEDYLAATQDEIPERWYHAMRKLT